MNKIQHYRILAIAPSFRGFGFVVLEDKDTLVDWGVKTVHGNKNANSLVKVEELIAYYQPKVLVLEDSEGSRRYVRIKALIQKIIAMAAARKVSIKLFSQEQVRQTFFADGKGIKHEVAKIIAQRFPEELASRLPPKRKPWMSEHYQMDIFDAMAIGLAFYLN